MPPLHRRNSGCSRPKRMRWSPLCKVSRRRSLNMADSEGPKALVLEFYKLALEQFRPKEALETYATQNFVDHNTDVAGGTRQATITFLESLIGRFPAPEWKIVRSAA